MHQSVAKSIGGAPNEIEEMKPTLLPSTCEVEEASASMKQILASNMMSSDVQELRNLLEVNRLEDVEELSKVLEVLNKRIQNAREEVKSTKAEKKSWKKKGKKGESKLMSKVIIASATDADKGDNKLLSKVTGSVNDAEKVLQKISDIGYKPTLTSGNKVASESYTLLQQALKGLGNLHYAAVGLSMVAYVLERVNVVRDNSGKCLALLQTMYKLGRDMVNAYQYLPENGDLLEATLTEITKGVYFCCTYTESGVFRRFGLATVNKDEFDTLSKTMQALSDELVRASQVSGLKIQTRIQMSVQESHTRIQMSVQESHTSLSHQITQLSKQFPTVAIQANKLCSPVALLLEGQTSLSNNMTECELLGSPVMTSLEPEHTTNTGYGLPEASARDTEYPNVVVPEHSSVSKSEETRAADRPENFQHLPKHMTDMHIEEDKIISKLETVTTLGLVGMGGVGKTTLAKAVFNILGPKFDYSCFVSDVKLIGRTEHDVKKELWECLYFQGRKVGGKCNFSVLRGKRLLLALDDVSDRDIKVLLELAEETDPASRFIWTSRERDLLKEESAVHEVPFLAESHSRLLFMKHAFSEERIPGSELGSLVESVVKKCDGLPLALEVLGKYLRGKEKPEVWEATLSALETAEKVKNLNQRLWAKLRVSFENLGENELEIFLDATNFFCGNENWTLREAKIAWRAANGAVSELWWQTLVDMSLVYDVGEEKRIKVHEQLRSVGRMIASEPEHNGKYQVWKGKALNAVDGALNDADGELEFLGTSDALQGKEVRVLQLVPQSDPTSGGLGFSVSLDALLEKGVLQFFPGSGPASAGSLDAFLDRWQGDRVLHFGPASSGKLRVHSSSPAFRNLRKLRFLEIDTEIQIVGATEDKLLPTQLVFLQCAGHVLFNPALQTHLAILKLSEMEYVPSSIGQLSKLSHLEMKSSDRRCHSLPECFGKLSSLTFLDIECSYLLSLPESFGHLQALQHLTFSTCSLQSLPESFGHLQALQHLRFSSCSLQSLPESFGHLQALQHLTFYSCSLQSLPESFGQLSALEYLLFHTCNSLQSLCESFGLLRALEYLQFCVCTSLASLPESLGQLSTLTCLRFSDCNSLELLPQSIGQLSGLQELSFLSCPIETLPESFGQLSALTHLSFQKCLIESLPESFGQLCGLTHLSFEMCPIESVPESFGQLSAITHVFFEDCPIESLPESFGQLSTLTHLSFDPFPQYSVKLQLSSLTATFGRLTSLQRLNVGSASEGMLHTLGSVLNLRCLQLSDYSITTLPECIRSLPSLRCVLIIGAQPIVEWLPWLLQSPNGVVVKKVSRNLRRQEIYQVFHVYDGKCFLIEESPVVSMGKSQFSFLQVGDSEMTISKLLDL